MTLKTIEKIAFKLKVHPIHIKLFLSTSRVKSVEELIVGFQKFKNENPKPFVKWVGGTRRNKMYQPLAFKVMDRFLKQGFALKEDIIKKQHNCKATGFWVNKSKESNFLLIMHEHLFVFQK